MTRRPLPPWLAPLVAVVLAGCGGKGDDNGPIEVSAIGAALTRPLAGDAADRESLDPPAAALVGATRQGLLRYDAAGQVAPGLAARWSVSDDGRSLLFRLTDEPSPISAAAIVRRLRSAIAATSRNPLRPLLGAIASVEAVTPQVIDVELRAPRPTLLPLFAQPALGLGSTTHGDGPFVLERLAGGVATLRAMPDRDADPDAAPTAPLVVHLRGDRAATAVARFAAGRAALVTGGGFADLAIARAAALPAERLRFDPVAGLFGLAFATHAAGPGAEPEGRRALAMALDRERIARALDVPGWTPATAILPADGTPEIAETARPDWADLPLADRRTAAAQALVRWRSSPPLRVAMPAGPGARLLFALIAADWQAVGIGAVAVPPGAPADLALVDEVAPADTAAFYLRRFACERGVACTPESDAVLIAAREAPTLAERSRLLAQADALIGATAPFVALGPPIRWSLVAPSLDGYAESPRGIHPLDELRRPAAR
ncbi:ABC transporter substrate-binding protein [Sphingomonas sp.]|uniref:ABC transporter substrate-binding protein n=1 Tax=Sphingomonas sp. TaxID=28214 RepID=UPI003AFF7102